jgi:hypothetical protein
VPEKAKKAGDWSRKKVLRARKGEKSVNSVTQEKNLRDHMQY